MCGQTDNNSREILQNLQALGEPPVFFALLQLGDAFFLVPLVVALDPWCEWWCMNIWEFEGDSLEISSTSVQN